MDTRKVFVRTEKIVPVQVPYDVAFRTEDLPGIGLGDEALRRFVEITRVVEGQAGGILGDGLECVFGRRLALGIKMLVGIGGLGRRCATATRRKGNGRH